MKLSYVARALFVSASLVACAVHGADEGSSSANSAITGNIDTQRACAAAATYTSNGPNDFDTPADEKLPAKVLAAAGNASVSHFEAPSVGDVYASSLGTPSVTLFDVNGRQLAIGIPLGQSSLGWLNPKNGETLDCSGTPYNVNGGFASSSSSSSGGSADADGGTYGSSSSSSGWTDADGGTWTDTDAGVDDDGEDGGIFGDVDAGH